ncbi:hypothetical protein M9H77_34609 [Catharanthus roseus]|uniref:Uncharacterized protein n=1 Tax=Catharanthus roseus TaxID=4058 RepID=A0ACB9ZLN4_CATRO|nr:hypothetical protein M9H77_34609 [Catharanthus roseus]
MSSKFISMSISHLVANDPEIPVSNVVQEVQVLFQTVVVNGKHIHCLVLMLLQFVENMVREQILIRTYQSNFYSVLNENFWRDVPYNLIFHLPNMNNEQGRKQGIRFQGEMDYRNSDSPPRYGRCCMPGHNGKNCNNPSSSNV